MLDGEGLLQLRPAIADFVCAAGAWHGEQQSCGRSDGGFLSDAIVLEQACRRIDDIEHEGVFLPVRFTQMNWGAEGLLS